MTVTRRAALRSLVAAAAGAATGAGAYGYAIERHRIRVTRVSLPVSGLPPPSPGFVSGSSPTYTTARSSARTMWLGPWGCSSRSGRTSLRWAATTSTGRIRVDRTVRRILGALDAPHGVFAVLGNHDHERATTAALEQRRDRGAARRAHAPGDRRRGASSWVDCATGRAA